MQEVRPPTGLRPRTGTSGSQSIVRGRGRTRPDEASVGSATAKATAGGIARGVARGMARTIAGLSVATLASCGGSGGGDGNASSGGFLSASGVSPATLELFLGSLGAIHPDAPDSPLSIDPDAVAFDDALNRVGPLVSIGGSVVDGTLADAKVEWVVYPRDDGTLQRVSTDPDAGLPTPIRISSESAAIPFCDARMAIDPGDPTNARLAYASDGVDCEGDLVWRVVALADDAATDPLAFPGRPLEALVDPQTGAHRGWLALEDGTLDRLSPSLAVEQADLLVGIVRGETVGATADGTLFLELDQRLYAYDQAADRLRDLDFEFEAACPCGAAFASGRDHGLLVAGGKLRRADPDRGRVSVLASAADGDPHPFTTSDDFVTVGASRIAWSYTTDDDGSPLTVDDQEAVIRSVRLDGGGGITLDHYPRRAVAFPTDAPFAPTSSDDWLFYNRIQTGQTFPVAMTANLEGGQFSLGINSVWVGRSVAPVLGPARLGPVTRLLRLGGVDDVDDIEGNPFLALSLTSVDPDAPREVRLSLGDLPDGARFAWAYDGYGPRRIGVLLAPDGGGGLQTDLISWDDETEDSLERVTVSDGTSERPAPLF